MLICRKIPWTSQPQYPVGADWSNPLTKGLVVDYQAAINKDSLASSINPVVGNITRGIGAAGQAAVGTYQASNNYLNLGRPALPNNKVTLEALLTVNSFQTAVSPYISGIFGGYHSNAAETTPYYGPTLRFNPDATLGNAAVPTLILLTAGGVEYRVSGSALSTNTLYHILATYNGSVATLYVNGVQVAQATHGITFTYHASTFFAGLSDYVIATSVFGQNRCLNGKLFLGRIYDTSKTATEVRLLAENPWRIYPPQGRKVFVSVAGGDLNITTTLATANASGFTANIDRQLVIATSLGTATASGFTANVDRQLSITTTLATATASGFTANISSDLNVTATLATAIASAFSANVDRQLSITTTLATANASGFTANVDRQLFITTTLATATASGFDASIALGGGLNITATRAVATASGFVASVTISTPQGSGWETYVAPIRKKTVKQFKEEFNNLTYFELEEKEDEVKSEIRLVEQDIRLNEDLGLDNLILKLKLALKIQKAKLQAIKSVKQEKIQEAQVQQIQYEAIPIEYTQDIDIIHEDENIDADLSYIAAILRMKYFN